MCFSLLSPMCHISGQGGEQFPEGGNCEEPLSSSRCQRGGSPQPPLPGQRQPEGGGDLHEPQLLTITCHIHNNPDSQVSRTRCHHKVSTAFCELCVCVMSLLASRQGYVGHWFVQHPLRPLLGAWKSRPISLLRIQGRVS